MNTKSRTLSLLILLGVGFVPRIAAQPTAISYEGYFTDANAPAEGLYDFRFTLYDLPNNGAAVAGPVFTEDLSVQLGRFRVPLDFGDGAFDGEPRWLEIAIRPGADGGDFTIVTPRQQLTPTPYALHAYQAGSVADGAILGAAIAPGTLDASHLLVPAGPLPGQVLSYDGGSFLWTAPVAGGDSVFSLNGTAAYYSGGNVGLGTSTPAHRLSLAGGPIWTDNGWKGALELQNAAALAWQANPGGQRFGMGHTGNGFYFFRTASDPGTVGGPAVYDLTISDTGNVGIGTIAPSGKLHLYDRDLSVSHRIQTDGGVNAWTRLEFLNANGLWSVGTSRSFVGDMFYIHRDGMPNITFGIYPNGDVHYEGRLGRLDVGDGAFAANIRAADLLLGHPSRRGAPGRALVDFGDSLVLNFGNDWGKTVIGSGVTEVLSYDFLLGHPDRRGAPGRALVDFGGSLVVNFGNDWGTTVIGGAVTEVQTLRITGGADLAEPFALSEQDIEPGSVVVIDEEHPGQLKLSAEAYDTRVAGIVSGANGVNPGIALHQQGVIEGSQNVALTGRVYAQADAGFGPIRPGDLLTTSDTPGHAMKVTDAAKAQGAILGKAMSRLEEGRGLVLVLVTLQ
jgi:hypothetical protein